MLADQLPVNITTDVAASGLSPDDLQLRPVAGPELAAVGVSAGQKEGYVIPYFDFNGNPQAFYRVKFLNSEYKYLQPKGSLNHIYFPLQFQRSFQVLKQNLNGYKYPFIIITEGEKKAASACKAGFPCIGVGGVDNWKSTSFLIPKDTKITSVGDSYRISIPYSIDEISPLAIGLEDVINLALAEPIHIILCYDSDTIQRDGEASWKHEVQRAAASLAYELRFRGIKSYCIRQLVLPSVGERKTGLDDFLVSSRGGARKLKVMIEDLLQKRSAFPRHPIPRVYIAKSLERRLSRKEKQSVALSILAELDARGRRIQSAADGTPYYFDEATYKLMPAVFASKGAEQLHEAPFGKFLYQEFGLSGADSLILTWLASQFTGEEPVEVVEPRRVNALGINNPDSVNLQISDSHFACVDKNGIRILTNGSEGILFEQDQVNPLDMDKLSREIEKQLNEPLKAHWVDTVEDSSIKGDTQKLYAALMCYLSPWLNRWRGLQIPLEIMYGEPGSGKSSLFMLRLGIMTGRPILRNIPSDMRDWYAGITSTGGMYVIDNVQFADKGLRQRISDELCRLITEPDPHIEMRKLYTTSGQAYIPVRTAFGFTAIMQPFLNADLIQRAAIFEMQAHKEPAGNWVSNQLEKLGREGWIAHHLVVLHKFFQLAVGKGAWSADSPTSNRLAHYEHCLTLMGKVLGMDTSWIARELTSGVREHMSEADWTLEGVKEFAYAMYKANPLGRFTSQDIAQWAQSSEEYTENTNLTNSRRLGRYLSSHKVIVEQAAGLIEAGRAGNRMYYSILIKQKEKVSA